MEFSKKASGFSAGKRPKYFRSPSGGNYSRWECLSVPFTYENAIPEARFSRQLAPFLN